MDQDQEVCHGVPHLPHAAQLAKIRESHRRTCISPDKSASGKPVPPRSTGRLATFESFDPLSEQHWA